MQVRSSFKIPGTFIISEIRNLGIPNLRCLERGCLSGPTLQDRPAKDFISLKRIGIRNIVDFREDASKEYECLCRQNNFSYFKFPLDSIERTSNSDFYQRISYDRFIAKLSMVNMLRKFFNIMRQGHAYIGCQYGIDRTNKGLALNYFLGSDMKAPRMLHWEDETQKMVVNRNVRIVEKVFHHLTPEQRHILRLPSSFKDILSRKMRSFLIENRP